MKHNCRWVLIPNSSTRQAKYCEAPVKYEMELDDDGNRRRKYKPFCEYHQSKFEQMSLDEDE